MLILSPRHVMRPGAPLFLSWADTLDYLEAGFYRAHTFDAPEKRGTANVGNFGYNDGAPTQVTLPTVDPTVEAHPGGGSLLFTIPGFSGANAGGEFWLNFSPDLTSPVGRFGENSSFCIRFTRMFDANFRNTTFLTSGGNWHGGSKQLILGNADGLNGAPAESGGSSVAESSESMKIVMQAYSQHRMDHFYRYNPGSPPANAGLNTALTHDTAGFQWHNPEGFPTCTYPNPNPQGGSAAGCHPWPAAGVKQVIRWDISLGAYDASTYVLPVFQNSSLKAWSQIPGQQPVCFFNYHPAVPGYVPLQARAGWQFGKFWFGFYMTDKWDGQDHATCKGWIMDVLAADRLIPFAAAE